jgi:hypothetical protein
VNFFILMVDQEGNQLSPDGLAKFPLRLNYVRGDVDVAMGGFGIGTSLMRGFH